MNGFELLAADKDNTDVIIAVVATLAVVGLVLGLVKKLVKLAILCAIIAAAGYWYSLR